MSLLPPDRPLSNRILGWIAVALTAFTVVYVAGGKAPRLVPLNRYDCFGEGLGTSPPTTERPGPQGPGRSSFPPRGERT